MILLKMRIIKKDYSNLDKLFYSENLFVPSFVFIFVLLSVPLFVFPFVSLFVSSFVPFFFPIKHTSGQGR
jgi:hypothetical protein